MKPGEVARIGRLARLSLSAADCERFAGQLTAILDYFAQLQEVDTTGTEPLAHPGDPMGHLREDVVQPWPHPERLLPAGTAEPFFRVPRILGA